jgi:hypothetical protein
MRGRTPIARLDDLTRKNSRNGAAWVIREQWAPTNGGQYRNSIVSKELSSNSQGSTPSTSNYLLVDGMRLSIFFLNLNNTPSVPK